MKVTRTLYVHRVADWRAWLRKHHKTSREIWLIFYRRSSDKPSISYNDAVDEALCFVWIDSIQKKIDDERRAQRFTPRRPGSKTSEMNKARARRLVREKRMTPGGLAAIGSLTAPRLAIAADIKAAFREGSRGVEALPSFPHRLPPIRVAFVEGRTRSAGRVRQEAGQPRAQECEERTVRDGARVGSTRKPA